MQTLGLLAIAVIVTGVARAQDGGAAATPEAPPAAAPTPAPPPVPSSLARPAATLETFINAMKVDPPDYEAAKACVDWGSTPKDAHDRLVEKLYGILIRVEDVEQSRRLLADRYLKPSDGALAEPFYPRRFPPTTALRRHREVEGALGDAGATGQIGFVMVDDGRWLFSARAVESIEPFYDALVELDPAATQLRSEQELSGLLRFEQRLPAWAMEKVVGLKVWQWIGIGVTLFVGFVLDHLVRLVLRLISVRVIEHRGGKAAPESLRRTVRPFGLAAAAILWLLAVQLLDLPARALMVIMPAVRLFAMLAGVWAAWRVTDLVGEVAMNRAERSASKFDDVIVPLIRKTVKIFIFIFGLIYIADSLDVPIAPLITGLGIGGAGFAFAAKDTLEHFFGSVTVILDRPFQVGDWVQIGDVEGTVEEVSIRSTRVRTFYNSLVTVPNGNLVRAVIDNYGRRKYRRWSTHLNITYDTPPDRINAFCEGVREIIRMHPYTRKDYYQVWLHKFGPHSLDVLLYVFFETPDWQTELRERHRLMLDVIRLADRLNVGFAFPTQTIHMYPETHDGQHVPTAAPDGEAERRAYSEGRRAVHDLIANANWRKERPKPYRFLSASDTAQPDTQIESKVGGDG